MPLSSDPQQTTPVWLDIDAGKPEAERPAFRYRFFTARQVRQRRELIDRAKVLPDVEAEPLMVQALAIGLAGWQNLTDGDGNPVHYDAADPGAMSAALTVLELFELAGQATDAVTLAEGEKKRAASASSSPPTTTSANSAPNAATPAAA
jgi:hypothetical protein